MAEFKSYLDYENFSATVESHRRYMRSVETEHFLKTLLTTSVRRQEIAPAGTYFFRAQLGYEYNEDFQDSDPFVPFPPERMIPLCNRAREGRANSKGIPYLYLSGERETAIAEIRPWVGSLVSIAQFVLNREIRLVNCGMGAPHSITFYDEEPPPEDRERIVWQRIEGAFSRPVTPEEDAAHYAPTQVIAEFFRESGLDGIAYGSALGPGHNLALFDIGGASLVNCGIDQIDRVKFESSIFSTPYVIPPTSKNTKDPD